jgi:hypothetical protein
MQIHLLNFNFFWFKLFSNVYSYLCIYFIILQFVVLFHEMHNYKINVKSKNK